MVCSSSHSTLHLFFLYSSTRCYRRRYVVVPKGHLWVEGDNTRSSLFNLVAICPIVIITVPSHDPHKIEYLLS